MSAYREHSSASRKMHQSSSSAIIGAASPTEHVDCLLANNRFNALLSPSNECCSLGGSHTTSTSTSTTVDQIPSPVPSPNAHDQNSLSVTPDSALLPMTSSTSSSASCTPVFNFNLNTGVSPMSETSSSSPTHPNAKSTPHKTVCFHSVTGQPGAERKITNAIDCLQYMINGNTLIKVKASMRQYRRFYTLEEDLSMIRWVPSTKKTSKARLPVKSIREVRPGKNTEVLKNQDITGMYSEDCTFSIMYGDEFESIDLIALSPEEANIWVTGLNFLIGLIKSPDSLEGREKMREKWLLDVFDEADADRKGMLDELETIALLKKLNERLCIQSLKQKIVEFEMSKKNGEQRGCISKHAFISLFTQTATRPDVYFILVRYCGRDYMTVEEFQLFLEGEQGVMGTSLDSCQELIKRFEPSAEAQQRKQLLIDGFTQLLLSEACDIVGSASKQVNQDMNQPFAHYYIASSHNTYLIEDQVKGPSSNEGYVKALQSGCRCVKIDCHDGPDGPMVYHGNTLTSKIPLEDILTTIRDNAFASSRYPVIVHLENHCSLPMQMQMANLIQEILGDLLFVVPECKLDISLDHCNGSVEPKPKSPSVSSNSSDDQDMFTSSQLSIDTSSSLSSTASKNARSSSRGKHAKADSGGGPDNEPQSIWSHLTPAQLMNKIIISGVKTGNKPHGTATVEEITDEEDESLDSKDKSSKKKILLCPELSNLISLVRVNCSSESATIFSNKYSNYEVVHLNESTANKMVLSSSEELTQRNKSHLTQVTPDVSRIDSSNLNPLDFWNCGVQLISMNYQTTGQIMNLYRGWFSQNGSCGYVLKPHFLREKYSTFNARRKDVMSGIDPMNIRIKIISGQQLPRPKGASLKASSIDPYVTVQCLGVPLDCAEARTRTVSNDGHSPIFDESFEFNVCVPELALIRFLVLDDDFINDDFIGQLTIPVSCLHPGYKHVRLQNMNGDIIPNASLFVKISITKRYGSKQKLRRKRSWSQKNSYDAKQVGIKSVDEQLKNAFAIVHDAVQMRKTVEKSILDLCDECSLPESANMAQCLRIITLRMASCPTVIAYKVTESELGYPCVKVTGELTSKLNRTISTLDRTLHEFHVACTHAKDFIHSLTEIYKQFSHIKYEYKTPTKYNSNLLSNIIENIRSTSPKFHKENESNLDCKNSSTQEENSKDLNSETLRKKATEKTGSNVKSNLEQSSHKTMSGGGAQGSSGQSSVVNSSTPTTSTTTSPIGSFKVSRKNEKVTENLFWNLSVIKNELDNLNIIKNDCESAFQQINRISKSLEHIFEREHKMILRSNSHVVRELSNANFHISHQNVSSGANSDHEQYKPPPLSPSPYTSDGQLRGILKKSTSPTSTVMNSTGTVSSITTNSHSGSTSASLNPNAHNHSSSHSPGHSVQSVYTYPEPFQYYQSHSTEPGNQCHSNHNYHHSEFNQSLYEDLAKALDEKLLSSGKHY